jgi:hypothetical protein
MREKKCKENSYKISRTNGPEIDEEILFSPAEVQVEKQELKKFVLSRKGSSLAAK